MEHSLLAIWSLAFTLGIMHAFDADHVLAVSALGKTRPSRRSTLAFCTHWAFGHGMTLMSVSIAVLVLGLAVPTQLSTHAELLVALLLMVLGSVLLFNIYTEHPDVDYVIANDHMEKPPRKRAVAIGMLHGLAGSAPLLAVIPLAQMQSTWQALMYLLLFSLGVIAAMFMFAGILNRFYSYIVRNNVSALKIVRAMVALLALGVGMYMLQSI